MKCINKRISITLVVFLTTLFSPLGYSQNFECKSTKNIVDVMLEGPTYVFKEIQVDPGSYIFDTMDGWRCDVNPTSGLRNGAPYIESLKCIWDKPIEATEVNFVSSGEIFKKNLGSILECFPDSLTEIPVTHPKPARGEGIRVLLDETVINPASGKKHGIHIQYDYIQSGESGLLWFTTVSYGGEVNALFSDKNNVFCPRLKKVIADVRYGFSNFKKEYDPRSKKYSTSIFLGGAQRCEVNTRRGYSFSCRWATYDINSQRIQDLKEIIEPKITACLGQEITNSREKDGTTFITVGDEARLTLGTRSQSLSKGTQYLLTLRIREPL